MTGISFFRSLGNWLTGRTPKQMRAAPDRAQGTGHRPFDETMEQPKPVSTTPEHPTFTSPKPISPTPRIAWGGKVSAPFKRKVIGIAARLDMDASHLMAIMAFETGRSFNPAEKNRAGSGATGLIQFMPRTAKGLGTSTTRLAQLSALAQLDYVEKYLTPYKGRMNDLPSAYMAVLYPRAVDKPLGYVLFRKGSLAYKLNRGLDVNRNGQVTKAEASAKVDKLHAEGLRPGMIG